MTHEGSIVVVLTVVDRLEVMPIAMPGDLLPNQRAGFVGVPEVDARPNPGVYDLVNGLREASEAPRQAAVARVAPRSGRPKNCRSACRSRR